MSRIRSKELCKAQDLVYDAFDEPVRANRIKLAKKALSICEDCADAYNVLGYNTTHPIKALHFHESALETAERVLGKDAFTELKGMFWGNLDTRPYMRAKYAIALAWYQLGDIDTAIDHMQEMLELNPNDNQGVRHTLCVFLYRAQRDEELEKLYEIYEDGFACWCYHYALWQFRKHGECEYASNALLAALDSNAHIPEYLLGINKVPTKSPPYIGMGDLDEAKSYAINAKMDWQTTPGALLWLRSFLRDFFMQNLPSSHTS